MKNTIYMKKLSAADALNLGIRFVAVPIYPADVEFFAQTGIDFEATIRERRNLAHHRKFFAIATLACENGILDKVSVDPSVMDILRMQYKSEVDLLLYIMKWLFLPLEQEILPDGKIIKHVQSISFREMDQRSFTIFYENCVRYWSELLGVTLAQIERNIE